MGVVLQTGQDDVQLHPLCQTDRQNQKKVNKIIFTKLWSVFIRWRGCVAFGYLSFGEALPPVGALRQQRVEKLHSLSERRQQHGRPHREGLNHHLVVKHTRCRHITHSQVERLK